MHYLLIYELVPEYLQRRGEFRTEHLKLAWEANSKGDLVLAGAIQEPVDTALLMFKGDTPEGAENFAKNDPYVLNGLVKKWSVRPWATVVGNLAANPTKL